MVLEINNTGCDNKTVQEAIQLISSGKGNKLQLVVQKQDGGTVTIPPSHLSRPNSRPSSRSPSRRSYSPEHDRHSEPTTTRHDKSATNSLAPPAPVAAERSMQSKPPGVAGGVALPAMVNAPPPQKQHYDEYQATPTITQAPQQQQLQSTAPSTGGQLVQADEKPRQVIFIKAKNVGIRLAGGNDVGIFVASVQDGSPASQQGLRHGDQILEVNGLNFRQITREEAVIALMDLPIGSEVRIYAQYKPRHYESILERGTGDSFYIRTHFKYETNQQHELSFKKGT